MTYMVFSNSRQPLAVSCSFIVVFAAAGTSDAVSCSFIEPNRYRVSGAATGYQIPVLVVLFVIQTAK